MTRSSAAAALLVALSLPTCLPAGEPQLQVPCGECPYLYKANPEHPDVSSQGLRDREYAIPKPVGLSRVLVLGDSVTFGTGVQRAETFPKRLEQKLRQHGIPVEVINAGVNGYTAYNEVHYYLGDLRKFQPDVVVLAAVMNDVANPRLHWGVYSEDPLFDIPAAAIPNAVDDRERVADAARSLRTFNEHVDRSHKANRKGKQDAAGRSWPVYVTGEDSLSIDVLLDYDSPEWRWLRGLYDQLAEGVRKDGARLLILVLPLAYQLEEDYPYNPQPLFQRYCRSASITCLDPLAAFRRVKSHEPLFIGTDAGYLDIWHLTRAGHDLVARELAALLVPWLDVPEVPETLQDQDEP